MLKHLPAEFGVFLDHISSLDYFTKPDYQVWFTFNKEGRFSCIITWANRSGFGVHVYFLLLSWWIDDYIFLCCCSCWCQCLTIVWKPTMSWKMTPMTGSGPLLMARWRLVPVPRHLNITLASLQHTWGMFEIYTCISTEHVSWCLFSVTSCMAEISLGSILKK